LWGLFFCRMIPRVKTHGAKMDYPKTRAEAKATGATHYFTGLPCVRKHIALRKTKGACIECVKEDWQIDNERRKLLPKSEAAKEAGRRYYEKNKELVKARANHRPAEEKRRARRNWDKTHVDEKRINTSNRKRRHRMATPKWLSYLQKQEMKQLYLIARQLTKTTGVRYVVDHIVPLRSDAVCGLHVPWNLQVITQVENLQKSNKLVDTPAVT
jgi:hypothetical protein